MAKHNLGSVGSDTGPDHGVGVGVGETGPVDTNAVGDAPAPKRGGWPKGKSRGDTNRNNGGSGSASNGTARTARTQEKASQLDLSGIAGALVGIHMALAAIANVPELVMDDQEAENIAKSVVNVARHYPKVAGSQKLIDWSMLVGALGMAYVPRIMMVRDRLKKNGAKQNDSAENKMAPAARMQ